MNILGAFGAVGPGGALVRTEQLANRLPENRIKVVRHQEEAELHRRERLYRSGRPPLAPTIHLSDQAGRGADLLAGLDRAPVTLLVEPLA